MKEIQNQFRQWSFLKHRPWCQIDRFQITQIYPSFKASKCWLVGTPQMHKIIHPDGFIEYPPPYSRNNHGTLFPSIQTIIFHTASITRFPPKRIVAHQHLNAFYSKKDYLFAFPSFRNVWKGTKTTTGLLRKRDCVWAFVKRINPNEFGFQGKSNMMKQKCKRHDFFVRESRLQALPTSTSRWESQHRKSFSVKLHIEFWMIEPHNNNKKSSLTQCTKFMWCTMFTSWNIVSDSQVVCLSFWSVVFWFSPLKRENGQRSGTWFSLDWKRMLCWCELITTQNNQCLTLPNSHGFHRNLDSINHDHLGWCALHYNYDCL